MILHFTVVCLVAKPLNRSEARDDFVVIQTLLLFVCKSLFIMLTSFASLSYQPLFHTKAWLHSTQL